MVKATGPLFLAAASFVASVASAARVCGNGTSSTPPSYQYQLIDVRYDGPDPTKTLGVSTIGVQLGSGTTPLYECVAQWPEAWAGWYEGGSSIIWTDCIGTGAGFGADKTVSFAMDWKAKKAYLSHSFDCSDKRGFEGAASGSLAIDFECSTWDGASYCIPKSTSAGARPSLRISTSVNPALETSTCASSTRGKQSWRVENWLRRYEMAPGSSTPGAPLKSDTGPSFTLRNLLSNTTSSCATSKYFNNTFEGACKSDSAATSSTAVEFSFDSRLNILKFSERHDCGGSIITSVGVAYYQSICDRGFNSVVFTCTSEPLWVAEGVV